MVLGSEAGRSGPESEAEAAVEAAVESGETAA